MHWATRLFPGYLGDRRRIYLVEFRTAAGELAIFALLAPASTPEPIIAKLHREAVRILALPDVRKRFDELGVVPMGTSPAQFAAAIASEAPLWAKLIKAAGAKRVD
jgi:tripartite-type tricarboxylate transporter receptor subunit TctC